MNTAVYILNTCIFALCGALLLRGYWRGRQRLLLWSGLCFSFLALSNFFIILDLVVLAWIDFYPERQIFSCLGMVLLLYGLIWESDRIR